jgi:hypothetical protein
VRRNDEQLDLIPEEMIPLKRLRDNAIARGASFIPIPPGSKPIQCRYCGKMIYLAPHPTTKKPHPVTIHFEQGIEPTRTTFGQGMTHKAECPDAINDRAHPHAGMKRRFHR